MHTSSSSLWSLSQLSFLHDPWVSHHCRRMTGDGGTAQRIIWKSSGASHKELSEAFVQFQTVKKSIKQHSIKPQKCSSVFSCTVFAEGADHENNYASVDSVDIHVWFIGNRVTKLRRLSTAIQSMSQSMKTYSDQSDHNAKPPFEKAACSIAGKSKCRHGKCKNFEQVSASKSHYSHLSASVSKWHTIHLTSHQRRSMARSLPRTHRTHPQGAAAQTGCQWAATTGRRGRAARCRWASPGQ